RLPEAVAALRAGGGAGSEGRGADPRGDSRRLAPRSAFALGRGMDVARPRRPHVAVGGGRPRRDVRDRRCRCAAPRSAPPSRSCVELIRYDPAPRAGPPGGARTAVPGVYDPPRRALPSRFLT